MTEHTSALKGFGFCDDLDFGASETSERSRAGEETSAHGDEGVSSDWRLGRASRVCGFCELIFSEALLVVVAEFLCELETFFSLCFLLGV